MFDKGLRAAVRRWSSGTSRARTDLNSVIGRTFVGGRLVAFAVMVALVLSMTGCKVLDIG